MTATIGYSGCLRFSFCSRHYLISDASRNIAPFHTKGENNNVNTQCLIKKDDL